MVSSGLSCSSCVVVATDLVSVIDDEICTSMVWGEGSSSLAETFTLLTRNSAMVGAASWIVIVFLLRRGQLVVPVLLF